MIQDLRCSFQENPMGLDEKVSFSWKVKDFTQSHFQINLYNDDKKMIFQSGRLASTENAHIELDYEYKPLCQYYFQVEVWSGRIFLASDLSSFETGFMGTYEPSFISAGRSDRACLMFRKRIDLDKPIKKARLYTSALGVYEVYLNACKVGSHKLAPG